MSSCVKCGLPLEDDNKCTCNLSLCSGCCACEIDCSCGCADMISDLPEEEEE